MTVKEILDKILIGVKKDESYWLQVDKEYEDFMSKATAEEKKELNNNWAVIESMKLVVSGYKHMKETNKTK
jgi:hypothetical protein